jgi:hypothetical protein
MPDSVRGPDGEFACVGQTDGGLSRLSPEVNESAGSEQARRRAILPGMFFPSLPRSVPIILSRVNRRASFPSLRMEYD